MRPLYRAEGRSVHKRSVGVRNTDGSTSYSLGFRVCTIEDGVDDEGAQIIADALNAAEQPPADEPD